MRNAEITPLYAAWAPNIYMSEFDDLPEASHVEQTSKSTNVKFEVSKLEVSKLKVSKLVISKLKTSNLKSEVKKTIITATYGSLEAQPFKEPMHGA